MRKKKSIYIVINSMTNIIELEKGLFSNLQSEFYKFINSLKNNSDNKHLSEKIILLNEQMRLLENMLYELKIDIYSNNTNNNTSLFLKEQIDDYEKDKKVIEKFKPFMLYYRLILDVSNNII
jgi:hypothetical protein